MAKRLLDLFCGAGGCSVGYHRAGFDVVGVDIKPQKNYPFEFHCADAFAFLEKHGHEFDVIHASPPCQAYSVATPDRSKHRDLVGIMREALQANGKPFVIENVPGAPMNFPITLCGTMFCLCDEKVVLRRHRLFESPLLTLGPGGCSCKGEETAHVTGHMGKVARRYRGRGGMQASSQSAKRLMGIDWMNRDELAQAIPPAYTEWIGQRLMEALSNG